MTAAKILLVVALLAVAALAWDAVRAAEFSQYEFYYYLKDGLAVLKEEWLQRLLDSNKTQAEEILRLKTISGCS